MMQTTKLLLLLALALTCTVAAGNGRTIPPSSPTPPLHATLHDLVTRAAVAVGLRVSAWAVTSTLAGPSDGNGEGVEVDQPARVRPEPAARPLMPFYSFASVLPRTRGG
jgi:hypothetical protein